MDSGQSHLASSLCPLRRENGAAMQDPQCLVVSISFRVTMFLRLPGGWGSPHFFSVLFPPPHLCTPAPLLAHFTQSWWLKGQSQGQDPLIQGLWDTSGQPQRAPGDCLLPGTAAVESSELGKPEKGHGLNHSKPSASPWIWMWPGQVLASAKGSVFWKHPEGTTGGKTGGPVPARLGQKAPKADRASPPQIPSPYCPSISHLPGTVQARGEERVYQKDHIKDAQTVPDSLRGLQSLAQPRPNPEGTACQACRPRLP